MNRTRSAWLSTALLCGALLAGCGSSSSTTTSTASSTPAAATQSTPASTSTSATTTPTATAKSIIPPTASVPAGQVGRVASAICKSTTARAKLPTALKAQVEAICHDYEKGDVAKAKVDAEKACTEAVEAIPNESPAKQQALARCKSK